MKIAKLSTAFMQQPENGGAGKDSPEKKRKSPTGRRKPRTKKARKSSRKSTQDSDLSTDISKYVSITLSNEEKIPLNSYMISVLTDEKNRLSDGQLYGV